MSVNMIVMVIVSLMPSGRFGPLGFPNRDPAFLVWARCHCEIPMRSSEVGNRPAVLSCAISSMVRGFFHP
jgi:hypothetical protein